MKIGIIGAGRIVKWFLNDLSVNKYSDKIKITGIYNRTLAKAQKYADEYRITHVYKTMQEFLLGDFDLVYIGTAANSHYQIALTLLNNNFNVYCEKPITLKYEEALILYQKAKKSNLIFFDGIKTPFSPTYQILKQKIASGIIGKVLVIRATNNKINSRLIQKPPLPYQKIGGYHFDGGVYPWFQILDLGGPLESYYYYTNSDDEKNDNLITTHAYLIRHQNQIISTIIGSDHTSDLNQTTIQGTKGYIVLGGNKNESAVFPLTLKIYDLQNNLIEEIHSNERSKSEGLVYVLEHVYQLWKNKQISSLLVCEGISLKIIKILETTNCKH